MLQRIQTLFLGIAVVGLAVFLATTTWSKTISPTEQLVVNPYYILHTKNGMAVLKTPIFYIATVAVFALGFTIFTIFQYKNRVRQMLFVALNSLLMGIAMALSVYHIMKDATLIVNPTESGDFGIGLVAIFVALISNWLANRFIKRDEQLVRDAERMR
jgi:Domain of unknown function (DUF4293)